MRQYTLAGMLVLIVLGHGCVFSEPAVTTTTPPAVTAYENLAPQPQAVRPANPAGRTPERLSECLANQTPLRSGPNEAWAGDLTVSQRKTLTDSRAQSLEAVSSRSVESELAGMELAMGPHQDIESLVAQTTTPAAQSTAQTTTDAYRGSYTSTPARQALETFATTSPRPTTSRCRMEQMAVEPISTPSRSTMQRANWLDAAEAAYPAASERAETRDQLAEVLLAANDPAPATAVYANDSHSLLGQMAQADRTQRTEAAKAQSDEIIEMADSLSTSPWKTRGPQYPGQYWPNVKQDFQDLFPMIWDDTKAIVTNPTALILLGMSAGSWGFQGNNGDDDVADYFSRHGNVLGKGWDQVGDIGGNPGTHFAIAGALYFASLYTGDTKTYEVSKTMLSALSINGIATVGLKYTFQTESPNGDEYGWPSGHTSSSFAMAAVVHKAYGPWAGIPAYAFASFVGFERLAARNHDLTDVVGGAFLGLAIGYAVAENHEPMLLGMHVLPYTDPRGGLGLALYKRW